MPTVEVTPIAQRAKWAQQRTQYDEGEAPAAAPAPQKPTTHRLMIVVEGTPEAIDRVLDYAERHVNVRGTY